MRSLTLKLMLAFIAVSVAGGLFAAVFAHQATVSEFDRFVINRARDEYASLMASYYEMGDAWDGVATYASNTSAGVLPGNGHAPSQPRGLVDDWHAPVSGLVPTSQFALADENGIIVANGGRFHLGDQVPERDLLAGEPVSVGGVIVGTVLTTGVLPERDPSEARYLGRTDKALFMAVIAATGIALLLGLGLARTLTRPMRELTRATRAMARGELAQVVPVRSQDELGELADAFNQMSADLTRANDLRRRMTADIAHDLRTPLAVMIGHIEALRDGVFKPTPARFDVMYAEAQHLHRLVEDLRTLSLADAGELSLNRQAVSPSALLDRLAAAFGQSADLAHVTLVAEAAPDLPEIQADPERLVQVIGNLIANALRYTEEGGTISLETCRTNGGVDFMVRDNGRGMDPDVVPHVFERFYRGDDSRRQNDEESGLGLAIAKSIVEAHGGSISAYSAGLGLGSVFVMHFPV